MRRTGMFLFLFGAAMVLGSCVPVGHTLLNIILPDQLDQQPLSLQGPSQVSLKVPAEHEEPVRVALRISFPKDTNEEQRSARYSYRVLSEHGTELQRGDGRIDHENSSKRSKGKQWTTFEKILDAFKVIPDDALTLEVELQPATALSQARIYLYAAETPAKISIMTAIVLWVFGIILALTGGLLWLQTLATTPDAGRAHSAQMSLALEEGIKPSSDTTPRKEERIWAMLCHLTIFSGYLIVPFGHLLGPLIVWLAKREHSFFIDWHGREALNFNISITLYALAGLMLCLTIIGLFVGLMVLFLVVVLHIAATLYMALRAQQSDWSRYPFSISFISPPRRAQSI